ncbi:thiol-disulfide isomerase/thioredoxin [Nitrosomonas sp. Nm84]|uniref:TlpA disulfide reductase family protein n=1 Tax=Nitrosomonas sp. Nm84 TaxID=200124 RepID=UPI000D754A45|nr:TlpA disulfide reductase family protein [Nitrosomonas sp. Nm84]PXW84934.1 thiol-disulfide isomerase/thioredoxin [Nitrosomonas sp. Nm84]
MKRITILISIILSLFSTVSHAEHLDQTSSSCHLTTLDGSSTYDLQELKGKVVYMDFWASWCPPCAKSFPFLNQLNSDLKDKGLHVIGVNLDEKIADAQDFLAKHPAGFSIVADPSKQCAKGLEVMAMPTSYLIDRQGNIRHVHQGFLPGESEKLRALITQLVMEP